jgi:hypothetical protein
MSSLAPTSNKNGGNCVEPSLEGSLLLILLSVPAAGPNLNSTGRRWHGTLRIAFVGDICIDRSSTAFKAVGGRQVGQVQQH